MTIAKFFLSAVFASSTFCKKRLPNVRSLPNRRRRFFHNRVLPSHGARHPPPPPPPRRDHVSDCKRNYSSRPSARYHETTAFPLMHSASLRCDIPRHGIPPQAPAHVDECVSIWLQNRRIYCVRTFSVWKSRGSYSTEFRCSFWSQKKKPQTIYLIAITENKLVVAQNVSTATDACF